MVLVCKQVCKSQVMFKVLFFSKKIKQSSLLFPLKNQRKVNMLARDYCDAAGRKLKPVILSHHMLYGLKKGQAKMSKSDPDSAIFMEDAAEDVVRKIAGAYCPAAPEDMESSEATSSEGMSLVEDDLKNPCLDYIQYVLFSQEDYVFKVAGSDKVYENFEDLKRAFLDGHISEEDLKQSLTDEVNALLEPVRRHFTEDEHAKELLAQVTSFKKETLEKKSSLVHLSLDSLLEGGDSKLSIVFAPMPSQYVRLSDVLEVLERLRAADGHRVLWLEDWSAKCLGAAGGSVDCVKGFYNLFLHGLRSLDPQLLEEVQVLWQGEAILSQPSDYWTSVINTGRQCSLEAIRKALPEGETLDSAAQVVVSIMHVGDVLALAGGKREAVLCCGPYHRNLHSLAAEQFERFGLQVPKIESTEMPSLRLQSPGDGLEVDTQILVTDKEMDVNRKVKKAFCEPGNVEFNPPVAWVQAMLPALPEKQFVVKRKEENGGDLAYAEIATLTEDFASEALHPGDLKPSLGKALNSAMVDIRAGIKASGELKKAEKKLAAYIKSLQKKKK